MGRINLALYTNDLLSLKVIRCLELTSKYSRLYQHQITEDQERKKD
jgi:hypothetical protein